MKKVIHGRIFDTDKAELICKIEEGQAGSFNYFEADLYQTPKSHRFFLSGEGGPMTIFAKRCSDGLTSGSEGIIALTEEQALEFAERHANVDILQKFFKLKEA